MSRFQLTRLVATVETAGEAVEAVATELATAIAAAVDVRDAILVGPICPVADESGTFGLNLSFAQPDNPPRIFFANLIPRAMQIGNWQVRHRFRNAVIAALGKEFCRVEAFATLRALMAAVEALGQAKPAATSSATRLLH